MNNARTTGTHRGLEQAGFTLLELLVALSLGLVLSGAIVQALLSDARHSQQVIQAHRQRQLQQRVLALIRSDLRHSDRISATPEQEVPACDLGGRTPVLHLSGAAGVITYSGGAAPGGIWRGDVLMRCGPAYGLNGAPQAGGQPLNRVVLDGLKEVWHEMGACGWLDSLGMPDTRERRVNPSHGVNACLLAQQGLAMVNVADAAG